MVLGKVKRVKIVRRVSGFCRHFLSARVDVQSLQTVGQQKQADLQP